MTYKTLTWDEYEHERDGLVWHYGASDDERYVGSPLGVSGFKVSRRSADVSSAPGFGETGAEAKEIAERDYLLLQRRAAWRRYMAENDPPAAEADQ